MNFYPLFSKWKTTVKKQAHLQEPQQH
jgi:hypothetical protein